jgi:hypothetical protein
LGGREFDDYVLVITLCYRRLVRDTYFFAQQRKFGMQQLRHTK